MGGAPQLLHRHHRHRHVRHDAVHVRLPGEGHRVRRRQEARQDHRRDPAAVSAEQGHLHPERMPDRPDRRRHRGGVEEEGDRIRRAHDRTGALRRLSRRVAIARPPPRERRDPRLGVRQDRSRQAPRVRIDAVRRRDHRRLQHRWRRMVEPHPARGNRPARDRAVVGRRHARRAGEHAEGEAQRAALLPLDELHQPAHGGEVRDSVGRVQLLRPDDDREEPARDREPLRRHDQGERREGDREVPPADGCRDRTVQAAAAGQEGDAVRRRPASAPRDRRIRGSGDGGGRHRLRVRPQRRLPAHDALREGRHADLRRRDGLRVREVRRAGAAGPRRFRDQGKVRVPEDGRAVPADAQLGLLGPVPRLRRLRDLRARHGHGDFEPGLEPREGAVEEGRLTPPADARCRPPAPRPPPI
ncbi:hypothetical protein BVI2075_550059 [Burkholderia vietnamiensis]|nr:hypothetical protein BVI2075_550059 [Burkholderia vietnamiensis]